MADPLQGYLSALDAVKQGMLPTHLQPQFAEYQQSLRNEPKFRDPAALRQENTLQVDPWHQVPNTVNWALQSFLPNPTGTGARGPGRTSAGMVAPFHEGFNRPNSVNVKGRGVQELPPSNFFPAKDPGWTYRTAEGAVENVPPQVQHLYPGGNPNRKPRYAPFPEVMDSLAAQAKQEMAAGAPGKNVEMLRSDTEGAMNRIARRFGKGVMGEGTKSSVEPDVSVPELVNEGYASMFRHLGNYDPERGGFLKFLFPQVQRDVGRESVKMKRPVSEAGWEASSGMERRVFNFIDSFKKKWGYEPSDDVVAIRLKTENRMKNAAPAGEDPAVYKGAAKSTRRDDTPFTAEDIRNIRSGKRTVRGLSADAPLGPEGPGAPYSEADEAADPRNLADVKEDKGPAHAEMKNPLEALFAKQDEIGQVTMKDRLRQHIQSLPEEDRRILELKYMEGLPTRAAAQALGIPHSAYFRKFKALDEAMRKAMQSPPISGGSDAPAPKSDARPFTGGLAEQYEDMAVKGMSKKEGGSKGIRGSVKPRGAVGLPDNTGALVDYPHSDVQAPDPRSHALAEWFDNAMKGGKSLPSWLQRQLYDALVERPYTPPDQAKGKGPRNLGAAANSSGFDPDAEYRAEWQRAYERGDVNLPPPKANGRDSKNPALSQMRRNEGILQDADVNNYTRFVNQGGPDKEPDPRFGRQLAQAGAHQDKGPEAGSIPQVSEIDPIGPSRGDQMGVPHVDPGYEGARRPIMQLRTEDWYPNYGTAVNRLNGRSPRPLYPGGSSEMYDHPASPVQDTNAPAYIRPISGGSDAQPTLQDYFRQWQEAYARGDVNIPPPKRDLKLDNPNRSAMLDAITHGRKGMIAGKRIAGSDPIEDTAAPIASNYQKAYEAWQQWQTHRPLINTYVPKDLDFRSPAYKERNEAYERARKPWREHSDRLHDAMNRELETQYAQHRQDQLKNASYPDHRSTEMQQFPHSFPVTEHGLLETLLKAYISEGIGKMSNRKYGGGNAGSLYDLTNDEQNQFRPPEQQVRPAR